MLSAFLAIGLASPVGDPPHRFAQDVSYRIEARLDAREHLLHGRSIIEYRNRAPEALSEVFFHLYPNSFRDRDSTAAREQGFYHDTTIRRMPTQDRGYLDVEHLRVDGESVRFLVVDTILKLKLPRPLAPGASARFELDWISRIRRFARGSGHDGRHYELSDWYPKVAVYDRRGWHAEPAHDAGGSYGDFARFEVALELPRDLAVVATGELAEGDAGWDEARARALAPPPESETRSEDDDYGASAGYAVGSEPPRRRVVFVAERSNDFAWVAGPSLCLEQVAGAAGMLRAVYRAGSAGRWKGFALDRLARTAAWLDALAGPYPWSHLTLVETLDGERSAAPMLGRVEAPTEAAIIEVLTAMRFGSVVGSDGVGEAWLGQGMSAYAARRYLISRFGPTARDPEEDDVYQGWLKHTTARDLAQRRALAALRVGRAEPVASAGHMFRDRANRLPAVRDKASLFFDALEASLGRERFDRALAAWSTGARLDNSDETALREALEREGGQPLGPLFDSWLRSVRSSDLSLGRVRSRQAGGGWQVEFAARRRGETATPVDILVIAEDGSEQRLRFPAGETRSSFVATLPARLERIELDPESVALDRNRLDNRYGAGPELELAWPLQDYTPRSAYLLTWRPSLWYNAIDLMRPGMVLDGSLEGSSHRLHFAPSTAPHNGRFDFELAYATPLLGHHSTELELRALVSEGRRLYEGRFRANLSPRIERRPQTRFEAGFSSLDVRDMEYVRPERFEPGRVNQIFVAYSGEYAGSFWESASGIRFQASGKPLDSDFEFGKISASAHIAFNRAPTRLKLRSFLGLASDGSPPPREERFYLAGADPMAEFREAGLRSRDSTLTWLHWHLPGGGNFRAYNDTPLSGRRLFSVNFEAERSLAGPDSWGVGSLRLDPPVLAAFADLAKAEGTGVDSISRNALFGIGAGFRLPFSIYGKKNHLRVDFPFYVNRPGYDEDGDEQARVDFRWLVSLGPSF